MTDIKDMAKTVWETNIAFQALTDNKTAAEIREFIHNSMKLAQAVLAAEQPRCPHIVSSGSTQWCDLAAKGRPEQTTVQPPELGGRNHAVGDGFIWDGEKFINVVPTNLTFNLLEMYRQIQMLKAEHEEQATGEGLREALVETLQFYADTSKYVAPFTGGNGELYWDCGEKARATIEAFNRPSAKPGAEVTAQEFANAIDEVRLCISSSKRGNSNGLRNADELYEALRRTGIKLVRG